MFSTVGDVMTWTSLTIRPDCTAAMALMTLVDADSEELFVVGDDDRFLGILTDYELLKAELNGSLEEVTAAQLMHCRPVTLSPEQSLTDAAKLFREACLSRVPVLRHGRLLGMLQRRDILRQISIRRSDCDALQVQAPKFLQMATRIADSMTVC